MRCRHAVVGLWAVWATQSVVQALWTGASRPQGATLLIWPQALDVGQSCKVTNQRVMQLCVVVAYLLIHDCNQLVEVRVSKNSDRISLLKGPLDDSISGLFLAPRRAYDRCT